MRDEDDDAGDPSADPADLDRFTIFTREAPAGDPVLAAGAIRRRPSTAPLDRRRDP